MRQQRQFMYASTIRHIIMKGYRRVIDGMPRNSTLWLRAIMVLVVLFTAAFVRLSVAPEARARSSSTAETLVRRTATRAMATRATATPVKTATPTKTATATSTSTGTTGAGSEAACLNTQEATLLAKINAYRQQNGLQPLKVSKALNVASYTLSYDMGKNNFFGHTGSDGSSMSQRMATEGYTYATLKGENIAAGYATADAVFTAWKNSADHNKNMLNPNYKAIGIGMAQVAGSTYGTYWTTDFGGYVDAAPTCG